MGRTRKERRQCRVEGCEKEEQTLKHQLCPAHYAKFLRYGDPEYESPFPHGTLKGYRRGCKCDHCNKANNLHGATGRKDRTSGEVPDDIHGTATAYWNWGCRCDLCKKAGKEANRSRGRFYRFQMTDEQFWNLLEKQDFRCAICQEIFDAQDTKSIHIDHDHACCPSPKVGGTWKTCGNCVRGLLCSNCNRGLGSFKDDPSRLMAAVSYLEHCQ